LTANIRYASLARFEGKPLISLDASLIAGIVIFLALVAALNHILFKPLARVQAERESRTTGLMSRAQEQIKHYQELFDKYQAAIKNARMEAYKKQEELRAQALQRRAELLAEARASAESSIRQSRALIQEQVALAKQQLASEAQEIAREISAVILERRA